MTLFGGMKKMLHGHETCQHVPLSTQLSGLQVVPNVDRVRLPELPIMHVLHGACDLRRRHMNAKVVGSHDVTQCHDRVQHSLGLLERQTRVGEVPALDVERSEGLVVCHQETMDPQLHAREARHGLLGLEVHCQLGLSRGLCSDHRVLALGRLEPVGARDLALRSFGFSARVAVGRVAAIGHGSVIVVGAVQLKLGVSERVADEARADDGAAVRAKARVRLLLAVRGRGRGVDDDLLGGLASRHGLW